MNSLPRAYETTTETLRKNGNICGTHVLTKLDFVILLYGIHYPKSLKFSYITRRDVTRRDMNAKPLLF